MVFKSSRFILILSIFSLGWCSLAWGQSGNLVGNPVRDVIEDAANSYIFVFDSSRVGAEDVPGLASALAGDHGGSVRHVYTTAIKGFSANMSAQGAAQLAARNPMVRYYEKNGVVWAIGPNVSPQKKPSNPGKGGGGDTSEPPQVIPAGIARVGGPVDGTGRVAWVIDTGIDLDHPDLNVGNQGANFVFRGKNSPKDGNGHGTHVAGTIAAIDNAIDVVGVAAGATVQPVRVLDNSGSGTIDGVVAGVDYVAANANFGDCANMSLGGTGHWDSLHEAVNAAAGLGIRFAIAAGNNGGDANNQEPAHVEHNNVYTVSAIDANDEFAYFSNYGNPPVDLAAPGVNILSTRKGGGVTTKSGTSMAAPHVCGLLLLIGSLNQDGTAINDPDGNPDPIAHY